MPTISQLVLLSFLSHLTFVTSQPPEFRYYYCSNSEGNNTDSRTYQSNLDILLKFLTRNTSIQYGFYNFSEGQAPDKVSAIGLCRGDVKQNECRNCLDDASVLLPSLCPNKREAMGSFDECFLRYSNRSILGVMESDVTLYMWSSYNATEPDKYSQVVGELLKGLSSQAANGDSLRKYAAGNESGPNSQTVFGAVQCTPDLSQQQCSDCLTTSISEIPNCCYTKGGGRVIKPNCNIRYENFSFYGSEDSAASPPPLSPPTSTSKGTSQLVWLNITN